MKNTVLFLVAIALFSNSSIGQTLSLVSDINAGMNSSFPTYLSEHNGKIYFVAGNGPHFKLYSSNGTAAGTALVGPTVGNGVVWFLTKYNNKMYFTYNDGIHGLELWTSDGTATGTFLLKDIWNGANPGGTPYSSLPKFFTVCNGLLFFQASTAARSEGLWVTDGTEAGTQMLGNQYSSPFGSTTNFIVLNSKIYFQGGNASSGNGMWTSDGTTAGTQVVKSGFVGISGSSHAVLGSHFYFQNGDANGQELWKSDGTNAGTVLIKDINTINFSSDPQNFFSDNQKVYFVANDGTTGRELWSTDGTNAGTQLVKDINVGSVNSVIYAGTPNGMVTFNNELYSFGYNGTAVEMFKTNGTLAGTTLIKSISNIIGVSYSYVFNGKIYFVGFASVGGSEYLFESDGTSSGTFQITPTINTYSGASNGFNMLGFADELYFPAFFGSQGIEFCKLATILSNDEWNTSAEIKVYPNPTQETISIDVDDELVDASLSVSNLRGQFLFQSKIKTNNQEIDLAKFPVGMYFLTIQKGNKTVTQKIIKK